MKYLRVSSGSGIFVPLSDNMEKRYLRFPSLTTMRRFGFMLSQTINSDEAYRGGF